MLVLARKLNESICIGDDIRVTVVQVRQGRVRLGIEAPSHVRVRRDEVPDTRTGEPLEIELELVGGTEIAGAW